MIKNSLVSIIIITYNNEKVIEDCIKSINKSDYGNLEIIIVDGKSSDNILEIVKKFNNIDFISSPERGMGYQRNYGFNLAKGDYIFSVDADMRIHSKLISNCIEILLQNNDAVGLYVPEIIMGNNFFHKIRRFERSFYNGTVIDATRFFNREIAKKIDFFDKNIQMGGEDWDFDKRMKMEGKIIMADYPLYHDERKLTFKEYIKKKIKYMGTINEYVDKWGIDDPDIKKQIGFKYRCFKVFIEDGRWKKLIFHPVLSFAMLVTKFYLGLHYLISKKINEKK